MSAKFSEGRKRGFLGFLAECGNVTLAAERACVSRSWVGLHRANDAAFDQGCRGAVREAKARLRRPPFGDAQDRLRDGLSTGSIPPQDERNKERVGGNAPPADWAYLDGVELVVRGSNGRRCQIGRARVHQWTARTEERFLAALAATCNVKAACAEVGMHATSAYAHRKRWTAFAKR